MTSVHNVLRIAAVAVIAATGMAVAEPDESEPRRTSLPTLSTAYVLPAGYVSYNMRDGYRKYDGTDKYQHVPGGNFFSFGGAVGKRFALKNPRLRVQPAIELGYGRVKEDEYLIRLTNRDDIPVELYSNYLTGGIQADIHLLFPNYMRTYFFSAGPGFYITGFDDVLQVVWDGYELWRSKKNWALSPGINIGTGTEYKINDRIALSLNYNIRFMMAASFTEVGTMFPLGAEYREFFFSHIVQLQVLLPGLRHRMFYD